MPKILLVAGHSRNVLKWRMIGEAIARLKENPQNEIYYLDCHGIMDGYCGLCRHKHLFGYCRKCYPNCLDVLKKVGFDKNNIIRLKRFKAPKFPKFNTIREAIDYNFEGYNFGLGPISCIMTLTRNYEFDIKKWQKDIKKYFELEYTVLRNIQEIDSKYNFDEIHTFNGRMPFVYPVISYCKKEKKPFTCYTSGANKNKMNSMINSVPHDFYAVRDSIFSFLKNISEEDKAKNAIKWFENRRNGVAQPDTPFNKNQDRDFLPSNFDKNKENIVIFNTSIDEVIAFDSWKHPFANNENEIIADILEHYKNDSSKHFYLRIHPNLLKAKNKHTKQLKEIYEFKNKYKNNFTVIEPEEKVDTYALMQACDKVLVSYSTTGIEATYWGTPAILAGKALYDVYDCVYKAGSLQDVYDLIDTKKLAPKPKESTYDYGCAMQINGEDYRYFKLSDKELQNYSK